MKSFKSIMLFLALGVMFGVLLMLNSGQNILNVSAANKKGGDLYTPELHIIDIDEDSMPALSNANKVIRQQTLNSSMYSSTSYYYNLLDSTGQAYYDAIASAASSPNAYSTDTSTWTSYGVVENVSSLSEYYFNAAYECYLYDHLDDLDAALCMAYAGTSRAYSCAYIYLVYGSSYDASTVASMESQMQSARSTFISSIASETSGKADEEIEQIVHDELCSTVTYDTTAASSSAPDDAHTPYGALVDGYAVCDGYSTAFAYILDYYDIAAKVCVGYAYGSTSNGHAWNIIELYGQWYEVDCTWDDGGDADDITYDYYNITTATISGDHTRQYEGTLLPTATGTACAYGSSFVFVTSVSVSPTSASMYQNDTYQLSYEYSPSNASNPEVEWSSSDTSIATVDENGLVTAVGQGTCTITVTSSYYVHSASATITVEGVVYSTGTTIEDDSGTKYKVTGDDTVSYTAPKNKKVKSVTIPATVTIDGITYDVTDVSKNAFKNCTKLKKVNVGKNITSIGKNSFYNCKNLKKIVIKSKSITSVGKNAFKKINSDAVIKVPKSKYKAYKKLFKKSKLSSSVTIKKS